jgi:hypothetical protein
MSLMFTDHVSSGVALRIILKPVAPLAGGFGREINHWFMRGAGVAAPFTTVSGFMEYNMSIVIDDSAGNDRHCGE